MSFYRQKIVCLRRTVYSLAAISGAIAFVPIDCATVHENVDLAFGESVAQDYRPALCDLCLYVPASFQRTGDAGNPDCRSLL